MTSPEHGPSLWEADRWKSGQDLRQVIRFEGHRPKPFGGETSESKGSMVQGMGSELEKSLLPQSK